MAELNIFSGVGKGTLGNFVLRTSKAKHITQKRPTTIVHRTQAQKQKAKLFGQASKIIARVVATTGAKPPVVPPTQATYQASMQYLKKMYEGETLDFSQLDKDGIRDPFITSITLTFISSSNLLVTNIHNNRSFAGGDARRYICRFYSASGEMQLRLERYGTQQDLTTVTPYSKPLEKPDWAIWEIPETNTPNGKVRGGCFTATQLNWT